MPQRHPTLARTCDPHAEQGQLKTDAANRAERARPQGEPRREWNLMTEGSYHAARRKHYLAKPLQEVDAGSFRERLGRDDRTVPWEHADGVQRHTMDTELNGPFRQQLVKADGHISSKSWTRRIARPGPLPGMSQSM